MATALTLKLDDGSIVEAGAPLHAGANALWERRERMEQAISGTEVAHKALLSSILAEANKPELRDCTMRSVVVAAFNCLALGLMPGEQPQHCWILPYKDRKHNITEAKLIIGFRGLAYLAYRSKFLALLNTQLVFEGEDFERWNDEKGEHYIHKIPIKRNMTWPALQIAYCRWRPVVSEEATPTWVDRSELETLKKRGHVWNSNPLAMARKTTIIRASKNWSLVGAIAQASLLQEAADEELPQPSLTDIERDFTEQEVEDLDNFFDPPKPTEAENGRTGIDTEDGDSGGSQSDLRGDLPLLRSKDG